MLNPDFIAGEDDTVWVVECRDEFLTDLGHAGPDHRLISTALVVGFRLVKRQSGMTEEKVVRGVRLVGDTETGIHKMTDGGYIPELSR